MANEKKAKDSAMAAYMKANPARFPDSVRRPHRGCGIVDRDLAKSIASPSVGGSRYDVGILGGVAAKRLGFNSPIMLPME